MWMRGGTSAAVATGGGSGISLAPIAGGAPEADDQLPPAPASADGGSDSVGAGANGPAVPGAFSQPEVVLVAVVFGVAAVFFGIFPSPLFDLAAHAGNAISGLL
jgi:hypothetical protein